MSDIYERAAGKAATDRYEALFRVAQTLISTRSSEELFRLLARELRAVVNFYVMGVGIYDENAHQVHLTSYGEPGVPLEVPQFTPEETFTWWVYHHQLPLIIPSLESETRFSAVAKMLKNRGVRSVCVLPLTTVHRRLGGLAFGSLEADAYTEEEVNFLSFVANQVALAVDDALNFEALQHAEEALRASEQSFRLIVDSIPGLVNTTTAEGEFEFVSQQCLDYFGTTLEELKAQESKGWTTSNIVHRDDFPRMLATWMRSVETGNPYQSEYRIRRADGAYRWFHVRSLPWRDTEGRIIRWYTLRTDIDDRKQAEDRLQLLLDVTNQVVSILQLSDLLGAISSGVRRVMQCDLVSVCFPDSEMKRLQTFVIDFPDSKGFIREELISIEGSLGGFVFRTGKPWAGNASDLLQSGLKNEPAIAEGLKTGCVLPLISRNGVLGVLALGRREDNPFSQVDIGFLTQVANQVAIAVENATAYRQIEEARAELEKAFEEIKDLKDRLQDENVALREQIDQALMFEEIVGVSPALRAVLSRVSKVAPTDSTVLLTGETGTGKELIARAIHKRSRRSSRAFVSVNCAAIPASLIASELFGHEKGAFTGATQRRLGRFELAEEGTIFLDEVGELPAETQITLLHVLQEREFQRVGGNQSIRADARVIAATNRDLEAAIVEGKFRSDLFYRLNVFPIEIPPLRERREDIPLLVEYFIDRYARKAGKNFQAVSKKSLDLLQSYPWPGNIRELQNVIERSVVVCETENFSVDESWLSRKPLANPPKSQLELSEKLAAQEKEMIEAALRESGGRVSGPSGAAAKLGLHRSTLESKIMSLKIDKYRFKAATSSKVS
ncbi:MAG TPA: sigma 54-interacting transcriptional regulator [Candidatus Acidoferrum sp.]|nr:sigma 54-interacting transcriptional regulator [Candidatus Acidoferrum sp.]